LYYGRLEGVQCISSRHFAHCECLIRQLGQAGKDVYNTGMGNRVIRVSDTEAVGDFKSLLNEVRLGAEVAIEHDERAVAVLRAVEPTRRTIAECIALAEAHAKELGSEPTLDPHFAGDVAAAVEAHREPLNPPTWD